MNPANLKLLELLTVDDAAGTLHFAHRRMLLFDADAMGLLRKELIETLGLERTRRILTRFGYACGYRDALTLKEVGDWPSLAAWWAAGPRLHTLEGVVTVRVLRAQIDQATGRFDVEAEWHNSYEAEQHRAHIGLSDAPVCWTLTGYASGHATAVVRRLSQFPCVVLTGCELFTQQVIEAVSPGKDRTATKGRGITMEHIQSKYTKEEAIPPTNAAQSIKKLRGIQRSVDRHWVGDGFPVRTLFAYPNLGTVLSPFLLLDYAGPMEFSPTEGRRGVGEHPHRGFETVTIVYAGEVEHRDSSGGGGTIGPGDVQWMTAASGLVHEEFHGREFARRGGMFEMVQLWVNLPAKDKMAPPRYQSIVSNQIPAVRLPDAQGTVRVIAGEFAGARGPANTFTPMHVWDLRLTSDQRLDLAVPEGYTTALVVLKGALRVNGSEPVAEAEVGLFDRAGQSICIDCAQDATALLLCGAPIDEPIVGYGPFVMNSPQEIRQAIADYQSGKMGHLS